MTEYVKITDDKAAVALVTRVARTYRSAQGKVRSLTADAAYATEAAFSAGIIAKGAKYDTAREYAAAFDVAPATVTLWKRLGRALVVGVTTDSPLWQTLAFRTAANDKAVAEAIMADDATVAKIAAAVATTRKPDGSRATKVGGNDGKPNDGTDAPATDPLAGITDPTEQAMILVGLLKRVVADTDRDGWAKVESALGEIITRENTVRAKAAKVAADKAAKAAKVAAPADKIAS